MLLRYVLTLLEDLFVDPVAKVRPMFTKKSLNDSEISLSSETILSLTRISLTGEDLLPLPVREFINFQPALIRVGSLGRIDRQAKVVRFRFTHNFWQIDKVSSGCASRMFFYVCMIFYGNLVPSSFSLYQT